MSRHPEGSPALPPEAYAQLGFENGRKGTQPNLSTAEKASLMQQAVENFLLAAKAYERAGQSAAQALNLVRAGLARFAVVKGVGFLRGDVSFLEGFTHLHRAGEIYKELKDARGAARVAYARSKAPEGTGEVDESMFPLYLRDQALKSIAQEINVPWEEPIPKLSGHVSPDRLLEVADVYIRLYSLMRDRSPDEAMIAIQEAVALRQKALRLREKGNDVSNELTGERPTVSELSVALAEAILAKTSLLGGRIKGQDSQEVAGLMGKISDDETRNRILGELRAQQGN